MNCIGPTARSYVVSPSYFPPSVSAIRPTPGRLPSSGTPRIGGSERPSASSVAPAKRPWLDSTRPIAASSDQLIPHVGSAVAIRLAAAL